MIAVDTSVIIAISMRELETDIFRAPFGTRAGHHRMAYPIGGKNGLVRQGLRQCRQDHQAVR